MDPSAPHGTMLLIEYKKQTFSEDTLIRKIPAPIKIKLALPPSLAEKPKLRASSTTTRDTTGFFEFSTVDVLPFSPRLMCNFVRKCTKMWRKWPDFRGEKNA